MAGARGGGEMKTEGRSARRPRPGDKAHDNSPPQGIPSLAGVRVLREGRVEPLIRAHPDLTSAAVGWSGIALEGHTIPACEVPRHEHIENFLLVVLQGSTKCEVLTEGRNFEVDARPGTTFILPRGTVDELRWQGPTQRITVAINQKLLIGATDETIHANDIELTEHWKLNDPNLIATVQAMKTDLDAGSPTGRLYGEALSNALSIYLLKRYAARSFSIVNSQGGLPSHRLRRVIEYITANLPNDIGLEDLSSVAGMSPHYFSHLFKVSTGHTPHRFILLERIERAKNNLRNPHRSIFDAGLDAGFQNASHFARVFRKFVGVSPSQFRSNVLD
ncbi:MAG: hypothetical protein B7Y95_07645 [Rhizobiales bacterium 32-66-11]|nr:MAG: hypothetical protein B7Y95_07645 [Rhizobiales bacterium 32-66-11]